MAWLFQVSGTGSYPNLRESGWQRRSRFRVSHVPRATPKRSMASYAYHEHVG
jgi:hypothetical protein